MCQNTRFKTLVFYPPPSLYETLARLSDAVVLGACYVGTHPRSGARAFFRSSSFASMDKDIDKETVEHPIEGHRQSLRNKYFRIFINCFAVLCVWSACVCIREVEKYRRHVEVLKKEVDDEARIPKRYIDCFQTHPYICVNVLCQRGFKSCASVPLKLPG